MSSSLQPHGLQHFPVLHYLLEFAQTHVHLVSDAIQPSHPRSSPSPPALNLSQHQGLFQWVSFSHSASASVLPMTIQDRFPLGLTGFISLQSKGLSRIFSSTTVRKHQFFSAQPPLRSNFHPYMTIGETLALTLWPFVGKMMSQLFNVLSRFFMAFFQGASVF